MYKMKKLYVSLIILLFILLTGCFQINTENPEKAFRYWTHIPLPNSEVEVLNGKYWQSGHLTLEYEAYLQLVASRDWCDELIRLNNLTMDTSEWYCPKDVPSWFFPPDTFIQYKSPHNPQFRFWMQQKGDTVYIYDLQL
ncbi:hypothetical protein [uncultured Dysgonomonas sp.]|uniref:Lipoprotein n=1 Tax=uncultured Dysgonomonas sp. TaxID=206096 RepID=A0A212IVQ7_9BACT|nr:hypothetical protein [uncultured Dysgonomonas sp.]SBV91296.1 conserved exported hypothetical protein [uncultured Dysgonomonas sp.]